MRVRVRAWAWAYVHMCVVLHVRLIMYVQMYICTLYRVYRGSGAAYIYRTIAMENQNRKAVQKSEHASVPLESKGAFVVS